MYEFKTTTELKKTIPWKLAVIFLCFSAAIILVGNSFYKSQRNRIITEYQNDLTAIASLKIGQIQQWHKERLGDATVIRDNEPLISCIKQYFRDKNKPELKAELTKWMKSIRADYDYSGVLLVDTALKVRLSLSSTDTIAGEIIGKELTDVLKNHRIIMTDLHKSGSVRYANLDLLIPLVDPESKNQSLTGILILRIDPSMLLFPLIQSWPTPSKSSETLLLRRDGDSIMFLNELRHRSNTALILKLPLTNKNLLGSKAILGLKGIAEGKDYRNIPVVGYLSDVPGFPWFMVAKVDREEILSPLKRYIILIIIVIVLLVLINAFVFGFWIWNQQVRSYRSEELFRKLFENMLNGFAYCKMFYENERPTDFLYINVNEAFESLTGLKNVLGKKVSEVIPGIQEADPELLERYGRVALTGKPEVFETYLESLKMWFSISVYSPQKEYFVAIFDVISERKLIEETLKENEEKYRILIQNIGNPLFSINPDGTYRFANDAYTKLINKTPAEIIGKTVMDLFPPEEAEKRRLFFSQVIDSGEKGYAELKFVASDGEIRYSHSTLEPIKDQRGKTLWALGIAIDITERKRIEEALLESEDKFKYIFDHSVIGKSITFPSGEIHVNKAFCEMLGYKQEELEKTKWQDISHPDDIETTEEMIRSLISGEKDTARFIKRYLHTNGSVVWTDVGTALRRDEDGKPLYFITAINNITERKNAESQIKKLNEELEERVIQRTEQLQAANKELEAFSYSVSHDLRAPLRSVHGFTKILLEDYEANLDEEGKRICGIISSSANQMGELIDDLLSFSRIGRSRLKPSEIDMKKMVRLLFEGMTSPSETKRIKLKIGKMHKVIGDVTLLGQVWINLLSNAIKYSSKNEFSEISVGSNVSGEIIIYYIKDNGVGFDKQYSHKLFGVFQRLHSEAEFEGNGVGLAIVQRIILKHGGKVWAEGEVGKGATFYFSLPADGVSSK